MKYLDIQSAAGPIHASRIVLGSTRFGSDVSEAQAHKVMDLFAEMGGRAIDTARIYGDWAQKGLPGSEGIVGSWLKASGMRSQFTLITKGAHPRLDGSVNAARMSPEDIRGDIECSLDILETPIDLYFLHRDDPARPVSDILPILHEYVQDKRIGAIGASNWSQERIAEANTFALQHDLTPFTASEIQWSLAKLDRELLTSIFDPTVRGVNDGEFDSNKSHLPILAFSSIAWGFFEKKVNGQRSHAQEKLSTAENLRRLEVVKAWSKKTGMTPIEISVAYIVSHPRIKAAALVGASRPDQLMGLMGAAEKSLPLEFFQEIEQQGSAE